MSTMDFPLPARNMPRAARLPSGLLGRLEQMRARMAERRRARRDVAALLGMSDHGLRDVGMTRGEVLRRA